MYVHISTNVQEACQQKTYDLYSGYSNAFTLVQIKLCANNVRLTFKNMTNVSVLVN